MHRGSHTPDILLPALVNATQLHKLILPQERHLLQYCQVVIFFIILYSIQYYNVRKPATFI